MKVISFTLLAGALFIAGCRGQRSDDPPVHLNLNMDFQNRFNAQEANPFFADNRAMRPPVPGTIARGMLREDEVFYAGRNDDGSYVDEMPVPTTREVLQRGQRRYDIFCTPCHGRAGDGEGIVTTGGYGFTPAPTFHSDRLRDVQDGYLYDVITRGVRTMPPYAHQIPVADRWAIVAYVRALQRSQYATEEDVPPSMRAEIEQQAAGGGAGGAEDAEADGADEDAESSGAGEGAATPGAGQGTDTETPQTGDQNSDGASAAQPEGGNQ